MLTFAEAARVIRAGNWSSVPEWSDVFDDRSVQGLERRVYPLKFVAVAWAPLSSGSPAVGIAPSRPL